MHEERFATRPAALATGSLQEWSCTITLGDLLPVLPLALGGKILVFTCALIRLNLLLNVFSF